MQQQQRRVRYEGQLARREEQWARALLAEQRMAFDDAEHAGSSAKKQQHCALLNSSIGSGRGSGSSSSSS